MLVYWLIRNSKVVVKGIVITFVEIMKRKSIGRVLRGVYWFFYYNSIDVKGF